MTTVIITMAGFGRRFIDAGYTIPKYQILVHERTLFAWSMLSLRSFIAIGARFVFIVRAADKAKAFITHEAATLGIASHDIIELDEPTDGQATSALLATPRVARRQSPMLIYNIDTFVHPATLQLDRVRGDGWIPCFPAEGDAWSFAAADEHGRIYEVREKCRISRHATVGLYWFSSFDLYAKAYQRYFGGGGGQEMGERYVAPLYNLLIRDGLPVFIEELPLTSVVPLGVPAEVERFKASVPPTL